MDDLAALGRDRDVDAKAPSELLRPGASGDDDVPARDPLARGTDASCDAPSSTISSSTAASRVSRPRTFAACESAPASIRPSTRPPRLLWIAPRTWASGGNSALASAGESSA